MYLAIYRKYRPTSFRTVIGQEAVVRALTGQIASGRIGHAYLFTGTRGTGKTTVAKIFARAINCEHPVDGSPCGECPTCKRLLDPANVDIIEIDAASNNGVDEIRSLRESAQFPPQGCPYKVYIIDEVHMLTASAFNALLKTLEEPPRHAVFILATTEVHKVPATILSRCMRFDFKLVDVDTVASLIKSVYDDLGKRYTDDAVYAIAKAGEGSVRDALSVADTCLSFSDGELTYEQVVEALGTLDAETLSVFAKAVLSGDVKTVLSLTGRLFEQGRSVGVLVKDVNAYFRDLLVSLTCDKPETVLRVPSDLAKAYRAVAETTTKERLLRIMEIFADVEDKMRYSTHPRILFETAALRASEPQDDFDPNALLSRISALEKELADLKRQGVSAVKPAEEKSESFAPVKNAEATERIKEDVSPVREEKTERVRLSVSGLSASRALASVMIGLRKAKENFLWSYLQGAEATYDQNTLVITVKDEGGEKVVGTAENIELMKAQLPEYVFDVRVVGLIGKEDAEDADEQIAAYKKAFGDDIVIIK